MSTNRQKANGRTMRRPHHAAANRHHSTISPYLIALLAILAFSAFMEVYFFYGPSQLNAADDFLYTSMARNVVDSGSLASLSYGNSVFSSEYLLILGISAFYAIIGRSVISFAMFGIVTFIGTVLVVYLIGKELYNRKAALIAAFLYSFYPMAVIYGSNVSDTGPMAFFAALSVLLMIIAYKRSIHARVTKSGNSRPWIRVAALYVLSGALATLGLLITAEGIVILVPIFVFLAASAVYWRNAASMKGILYEFLGVAAGIAVIAMLSMAITGNPIHAFNAISGLYTSISNTQTNLLFYAYTMMPSTFSSPAVPINYNPDNYLSGYFLYAAIAATAYLIYKRDRKSLLPGIWFVAVLLYLSYGTMSVFRYNVIQFATRYAILFGPAMVLLAGRAFETFIGNIRSRGRAIDYMYIIKASVSAAIIILMLAQSLYLVRFISASEYESTYPLMQIAGYLNTLPAGSHIIKPYTVYLSAYLNKGYDETDLGIINSSEVPSGAYAVAGSTGDFPSNCGIGNMSGLAEVYSVNTAAESTNPIIPQHCNIYDLKVYFRNSPG